MTTQTETRYKFVVASAEEAVKVLRERLGEHAKVISVRQVEGAGLAKFLRAPKLEVIAQVTPPPVAAQPINDASPEAEAVETPVAQLKPDEVETAPEPPAADDLSRILQRGGISETILFRLRGHEAWPRIAKMPLCDALTEVAVLLRFEYQAKSKVPPANCVAFLGTAGAGKSTALCKQLALDVFYKQRGAVVLKVDMDKANPGDGLAVFCEVLGVPMFRSIEDIPPLAPGETLYIDFPGISPGNEAEIEQTTRMLESIGAASRVLVINAAYETALIKQAYRMGESLGATHVVFTHLDELTQLGKLWEFILGQNLTPLFLSSGQNIAGDFNEAVFDAVLDRTFPTIGKEAAKKGVEI